VQDTRVEWRYDAAASQVETTFKATTRVMEGPDNGPLFGLYPHHWFKNASVEGKLGPGYDSVRGKIRLLAAPQFKTSHSYAGFVPFWPGVGESSRSAELADVMKVDQRNARRLMLPEGQSAYWQGKGLQRIVKLMDVVEQQGDKEARDQLLAMLKKRMEEWFAGGDSKRYFFRDKSLGTVASYPDEFFAIAEINDHHFWYGYWIRAAAEIGLRDPAWIAKDQWGAMVELLIADIATTERGSADFPFLRNFDVYEGHAWANGLGGVGEYGVLGNNQESSSESINAWAGLILWGEITGNRELRDLGVYLYATEWQAINHYWFDIHGLVLAPEYKNVDVAQLFGGKYIHNTWWIDDPRQITGINLLPITTASTSFGQHPDYIRRNLAGLKDEQAIWAARGKKVDPPDIWQDVFAKYLALADPAAGLAAWNRWGAVELGETRSHTLHYLLSLNEMGAPDFGVSADTPLYSVFKRADGRRTYLAFNAGKAPLNVRFSDGKTLTVAPGTLARTN
jgi:endoglucanase Acf2